MLDDFICDVTCEELYYTTEDIESNYLTNDEISDIINM